MELTKIAKLKRESNIYSHATPSNPANTKQHIRILKKLAQMQWNNFLTNLEASQKAILVKTYHMDLKRRKHTIFASN